MDNVEISNINRKGVTDLDAKLDAVLQNINTFESYTTQIRNIDVNDLTADLEMKKIKEKKNKNKKKSKNEVIDHEISKLFNSSSVFGDDIRTFSAPAARRQKYDVLDELPEVSDIVASTLEAYQSNITIRHQTADKGFLNIVPSKETNKENNKLPTNFTKGLLNYYDMEYRLKHTIIPESLKYGDVFVELVDLSSMDLELLTQSKYVLTENEDYDFDDLSVTTMFETKDTVVSNNDALLEGTHTALEQLDMLMDSTFFTQDKSTEKFNIEDINSLDITKLKDIHLRHLSAHNVTIIESDGILYGYVVFEENHDKMDGGLEKGSNLTGDVRSQAGNGLGTDGLKSNVYNMKKSLVNSGNTKINGKEQTSEAYIHMLADKTLNGLKDYLKANYRLQNLSDDNVMNLKLLMYHKLKSHKHVRVRFIPPGGMCRFSPITGGNNAPYGTSVIEKMISAVKAQKLNEAADTMSKIARAPLARKWIIESGNRRNDSQLVNQFKQQLKSKSITYGDIVGMTNVNKIISDYSDIAVVSKNGQRFIDLEPMQFPEKQYDRYRAEELKKNVVNASGVPASYHNIEGASDLRENLVNINIMFANKIDNIQSEYELAIDIMIDKIFRKLLSLNGKEDDQFELSKFTKISFNHPTILKIQANEALINSTSNIISIMQQSKLPISPSVVFKEYLPNLDIENLIEKTKTETIENANEDMYNDQPPAEEEGGSQW